MFARPNIPSLLMVLYQMTGEHRWLEQPYAPGRSSGLDDNDSAQLSDELQSEIRQAALDAIRDWLRGKPLALPRPSNAHLAEMLSVAMTEHVPEEYGDIVAAGMSFEEGGEEVPAAAAQKSAIVIGGGISGICAGIELQKLGIEYTLFEKNQDFGGTWFENRYPGCGVDTPSLTYTFSCRPNDWSMHFPFAKRSRATCSNGATFRPLPKGPLQHLGQRGALGRRSRKVERYHRHAGWSGGHSSG